MFFLAYISQFLFFKLTWWLSLLFVRAPAVCVGLQHSRKQQQRSLLPLITVSWSQVAVWKFTQPVNKPCTLYMKDFGEHKYRKV